jgi:hypothetical protein
MNPLVWVSWGIFKSGLSSRQHACAYASWGLRTSLPSAAAVVNWLIRGFWWQQLYGWVMG